MNTSIENSILEVAAKTDNALKEYLSFHRIPTYRRQTEIDVMHHPSVLKLSEAMQYSLLSGGKRIRAFLTVSFCRMFGGHEEDALPLACALEMIHAYSLIHDDLPCVDNDDMRRGRPANHKVFGEAGALFSGDALLTQAFEVATDTKLSAESSLSAIRILSECAGLYGMLGGQMTDMDSEKQELTVEELHAMHGMKTGALIRAACRLGCLAAGVRENDILNAVDSYATDIGLAFQIVDDVLDAYGNSSLLGKKTGSDLDSGKTTFLSFYSREEAIKKAENLTCRAIDTISSFAHSEEAVELAKYLLSRNQ